MGIEIIFEGCVGATASIGWGNQQQDEGGCNRTRQRDANHGYVEGTRGCLTESNILCLSGSTSLQCQTLAKNGKKSGQEGGGFAFLLETLGQTRTCVYAEEKGSSALTSCTLYRERKSPWPEAKFKQRRRKESLKIHILKFFSARLDSRRSVYTNLFAVGRDTITR